MSTLIFASRRGDGLGERLRALTNAIFLADYFAGEFCFCWPPMKINEESFHAISSPEVTFTKEFIQARHWFPRSSDSRFVDIADPLVGDKLMRRDMPRNSVVIVGSHPPYAYIPELTMAYIHRFPDSFMDIQFSPSLQNAIRHAEKVAIPADSLSVHLRAGDILYGSNRAYNSGLRFTAKATPYQLAEKLIDRQSFDHKAIVLFGQDEKLLEYLSGRANVLISRDFACGGFTALELALFDITLMSRTEAIYAEFSGFSALASFIGRCPRLSIRSEFKDDSVGSTILSSYIQIQDSRISAEQKALSLRWLLLYHEKYLTTKQFLRTCRLGTQTMPSNLFFECLLASKLYALGRTKRAERRMRHLLKCCHPDILRALFDPMQYWHLHGERFIQPILDAAESGQQWARKAVKMAYG